VYRIGTLTKRVDEECIVQNMDVWR
jgi:hypothetical protein